MAGLDIDHRKSLVIYPNVVLFEWTAPLPHSPSPSIPTLSVKKSKLKNPRHILIPHPLRHINQTNMLTHRHQFPFFINNPKVSIKPPVFDDVGADAEEEPGTWLRILFDFGGDGQSGVGYLAGNVGVVGWEICWCCLELCFVLSTCSLFKTKCLFRSEKFMKNGTYGIHELAKG